MTSVGLADSLIDLAAAPPAPLAPPLYVSIAIFQAVDLGSIPANAMLFLIILCMENFVNLICLLAIMPGKTVSTSAGAEVLDGGGAVFFVQLQLLLLLLLYCKTCYTSLKVDVEAGAGISLKLEP